MKIDPVCLLLAIGFLSFVILCIALNAMYKREQKARRNKKYMDDYISRVLNDSKGKPKKYYEDFRG